MDLYTYTVLRTDIDIKSRSPGKAAPLTPDPSGQGAAHARPEPTADEAQQMPRRASRTETARNEVMTFRVTAAEKADLEAKAARAGVTLSGFIATLVTTGNLTFVEPKFLPMHPALFAELRRIGNNLNQLAHAANAGLPPDAIAVIRNAHDLMTMIARHELARDLRDHTKAESRTAADRPPPELAETFSASTWTSQLASALKR